MESSIGSNRIIFLFSVLLLYSANCILEVHDQVKPNKFQVSVDGSKTIQFVKHFWESTGFCPPLPHENFSSYFLSDDEYQNLAHVGATPNRGIQQVRIHWLLDLITVQVIDGSIVYNFTALDLALDMLYENRLKPGFEIMGNPSSIFTDFENKTQVYAWRDLVAKIAQRYIDRYSLDYVGSWNFESWNEPDNHDFDSLNFTVQGYLNYYDACLEGLKSVHTSLQLGTPGEACRHSHTTICMALLQHCYNGTNYFTGQKGVEVDYLSFHLKGSPGSSMAIIDSQIEIYEMIKTNFPDFKNKPIFNDEADPLSGWNKPESWRADARYAAMVVKIIALHQNLLFPMYQGSLNYQLLSNDNGFMNFGPPSFFNQRTLTARFLMNLTKPRSVEFIRKPVLSVMGLLSLLGSHQVSATVLQDGLPVGNDSDVGVIASVLPPNQSPTRSYEIAILIYRSNDTSDRFENRSVCDLVWKGMPDLGSEAVFMHYQLDNYLQRNPYANWMNAQHPVYPPYYLLQNMRDAADDLQYTGPLPLPSSISGSYNFLLPLPGVVLIHACQKPTSVPSKVTGLHLHQVIKGETMIVWEDISERCLLTYEVAMALEPSGQYKRVNPVNTVFSIHVHWYRDYLPGMKLYYKVRAVDYWNRPGNFSDPVCSGCNV